MKRQVLVASAAAIFILSACNNNTDKTEGLNGENQPTISTRTYTTRELNNKKLVDLKTNKEIFFRYDTVHYYYVDATTQEPINYYYYEPETKDTFDYRGYLVNNSLLFSDGVYTTNEEKLMAIPYNIELKKEMDATTSNDETKVKENENSYKEKTDTSKIKITDRKTKVKIKTPQD